MRVEEFKHHAREIVEFHGQVFDCKIDNISHAVKISMTGEMHISRAYMMLSKAKAEALRLRREANSSKKDGMEKMSRRLEMRQQTHYYAPKGIETLQMVGRRVKLPPTQKKSMPL